VGRQSVEVSLVELLPHLGVDPGLHRLDRVQGPQAAHDRVVVVDGVGHDGRDVGVAPDGARDELEFRQSGEQFHDVARLGPHGDADTEHDLRRRLRPAADRPDMHDVRVDQP